MLHAALAGTTSRFLTALAALGRRAGDDRRLTRRCGAPDGAAARRARATRRAGHARRELGAPAGHGSADRSGAGAVAIAGDVSSQFITALMLIGPSLPDGLRLELTTPLVSRPYVEMTAAVMAAFGVDGVDVGAHRRARRRRAGTPPRRYAVEPDASSASYPLAVAAVRGGRGRDPRPGRSRAAGRRSLRRPAGERWAAPSTRRADTTVVSARRHALHGIDVDMADMSDLVPTWPPSPCSPTRRRGSAASGSSAARRATGSATCAPSSARSAATSAETDDGLIVHPSPRARTAPRWRPTTTTAWRWRSAWSACVVDGVEVDDPDVVTKSWPGFWQMLDGARASDRTSDCRVRLRWHAHRVPTACCRSYGSSAGGGGCCVWRGTRPR